MHAVNTIISHVRAPLARAKCMDHQLLENAQWKHHLFNTHAGAHTHTHTYTRCLWGCKASLYWQQAKTVAHTYRSVQPSSAIHCDKQLAFHSAQANHSSGHSGDLYETWSNRTSMLHTIKRLRVTQNNKACGGWNLCRCQLWMRKWPLAPLGYYIIAKRWTSLTLWVHVLSASGPLKEPV